MGLRGGRGPVDGELTITNYEKVGDVGIIDVAGDRVVSECDAESGECLKRDEIGASDPFVLATMEHTFTKSGDDASY